MAVGWNETALLAGGTVKTTAVKVQLLQFHLIPNALITLLIFSPFKPVPLVLN